MSLVCRMRPQEPRQADNRHAKLTTLIHRRLVEQAGPMVGTPMRSSALGGVAAYSGGGGTTGVTSIRPVVPTVWASEATDLL